MPLVRFITLGCRLNQAEEASFAADFAANGWEVSFGGDDCGRAPDAVVLHSCAVTRMAERKTMQALRAIARGASPGAKPVVAVTGCAAAALPEDAFRAAGASIVLRPGGYATLRHAIEAALPVSSGLTPAAPAAGGGGLRTGPLMRPGRHHAMLKVQDGCDFRCSYCIVPFTRGRATSRPFGECVADAAGLAASGAPEIVVTGCNLACYHDGATGLPELVSAICEAASPFGATVSLGSVEPAICDDAIVAAMLAHQNMRRFVHLPVQSGDSGVLALARRRYDGPRIRDILALYRRSIPGLFLGADFITGLPGEDDDAFARTCALVTDFSIDRVHVFPYSPRPGTEAWKEPRPPCHVARWRAARLRALSGEGRPSHDDSDAGAARRSRAPDLVE